MISDSVGSLTQPRQRWLGAAVADLSGPEHPWLTVVEDREGL